MKLKLALALLLTVGVLHYAAAATEAKVAAQETDSSKENGKKAEEKLETKARQATPEEVVLQKITILRMLKEEHSNFKELYSKSTSGSADEKLAAEILPILRSKMIVLAKSL